MKKIVLILIFAFLVVSCIENVRRYGNHYQKYSDLESLQKATELIKIGVDTTYVRSIFGEPIDFGFEYRYLSDSIGENGCNIGAVFGIDEKGKIYRKDVFEICE